MISVWHKTGPGRFCADGAPNFPDGYELVASVHSNSLDTAYHLTNTIECGWWENDGVTVHDGPTWIEHEGVKGTRSTSVGDVLATEDGKLFECAPFGWSEIEKNTGLEGARHDHR